MPNRSLNLLYLAIVLPAKAISLSLQKFCKPEFPLKWPFTARSTHKELFLPIWQYFALQNDSSFSSIFIYEELNDHIKEFLNNSVLLAIVYFWPVQSVFELIWSVDNTEVRNHFCSDLLNHMKMSITWCL